jgi:hypothetical protein
MKGLFIAWLLLVPVVGAAEVYRNDLRVETRADSDAADRWRSIPLSRVDTRQQLIWVRIQFDSPGASLAQGVPLGLYVFAPVSYEAWWNGTFIGRNGKPGNSREAEEPGRLESKVLIPASLLSSGPNELLLRMSSFHMTGRLHAPIQAIEVREFGAPRTASNRQNVFRLMAGGALLLGAVYFGALFLSNRRDVSSLLLTLLSLSVLAQLLAESIRFLVNYLYPFHIVRLRSIVAFAGSSSLLLVAYLAHRHARAWLPVLLGTTAALVALCAAFVPGYDGKTYTIMLVGLLVSGASAVIGMRSKAPGARLMLALIAASVALGVIDDFVFLDLTYYLAIVVLLFVLFAQQVVHLRRAQRAQEEATLRAARLELELLRQQIQPHFLMNTLTALCEWVESDPAVGVKMIEALGEELRAIAAMGEASTIPLAQELDLCRHHLRVMGFRRNRQFSLKVQGLDATAPVPPAIFHTLIENAFTHNAQPDGTEFVLSAGDAPPGRCRYELRSPFTKRARRGESGKGHAYVRSRLRHAFGDDWHFSSDVENGQWVDRIEAPGRMACT